MYSFTNYWPCTNGNAEKDSNSNVTLHSPLIQCSACTGYVLCEILVKMCCSHTWHIRSDWKMFNSIYKQWRTQQISLIIHKNTPFRAFFGYFSHAKVQSMAEDCSGMVCSSMECSSLSVFGNSIVRLATITGVSSVPSERGGARQVRHYVDPPLTKYVTIRTRNNSLHSIE